MIKVWIEPGKKTSELDQYVSSTSHACFLIRKGNFEQLI